mgnify:CR=1 FL=1
MFLGTLKKGEEWKLENHKAGIKVLLGKISFFFPFMTTWMDLEGIMMTEINKTERQMPYYFTYMWDLVKKISKQLKSS